MPKIERIGNGTIRVSGNDALGNRVRRVFSGRRHGPGYEARAKLCFNGLFDSTTDVNIGRWARMTIEELAHKYADEHLCKTRAAGNKSYLDIITKKWGAHRVPTVTIGAARAWAWELLGGAYSPYTVLKVVRYMVRIFNWGVEVELLPRNPIERLIDMALKKEFKRRVQPRRVLITEDQCRQLLEIMPPYMRDITAVAWDTGMRSGEIVSVRWPQVAGNRITFSAAEDKEVHDKTVMLLPETVAIIDRIRADRLISGIDDEFVFLGPNGNRLKNWNVSCAFRHYADKAGLPNLRIHDLRHCYQVRMRRAGHDPKIIAAQLGHRTPDMDAWYDLVSPDEQATIVAENGRNAAFCQEAFVEAVARKMLELKVPRAGVEPARRLRSKGF